MNRISATFIVTKTQIMKNKLLNKWRMHFKAEVLIIVILIFVGHESVAQLVTYTFTNCGATGRLGPTQAQVTSAYASTNLSLVATTNATSGIQTWTVPSSGNYIIEVWGAKGGDGAGQLGGNGARIQGEFNLGAGNVLKILVGQMGGSRPNSGSNSAGAGGGGSFVTLLNNTPLIVAGGGGGAGSSQAGLAGGTTLNGSSSGGSSGAGGISGGGGGGALNGTAGTSLTPGGVGSSCSYGPGGGGFYTRGGENCSAAAPQIAGDSYTIGGFGGAADVGLGGVPGGFGGGAGVGHRAAGGGGWSGGGGDGGTGGGGGGGSFNGGINQVNVAGFNNGHGRVVITRLCNFALGTNTGSSLLCQGSAITLTTDAISNYTWSTGSNASSISVSPTVTTTYSLTAMSPSNCMTSAAITITVSSGVPVLTLTPSSNTVCLGNTVSIGATGALTYTFSGGISNGVPFTPTSTTSYTVQGQNGCGIASAATTISISPLPVTGIASSTLVCSGNSSTLNASGATSYTWSPGNITGSTVVVSPIVNTTYTLVGNTGNCLGMFTLNIATNPNPTLTATASNSMICQGESVTLTASGALGYTWQPGNLTGSSVVVSPSTPTAYVVTGNNSFGCTGSAQQAVIAFAAPTINISSPSPTICSGGTAILNASGANTYTWSTGPNTSSISVNPASTTVYTVAGTNTTTACSSTKTFEVNVFVPNVTVSSSTALCIGESITLNASGANSYQWSTGGTGSSILVTPNSTTTYTVTGLANAGNVSCSGSAVTTVTVNPLPTITAVATRSNICKNESTTISASGASTYLWGNAATTASITVSPTINTTYSVVGTDANGCKNSANIFIRVYGCVGLDENSAAANLLQVYPNPNNGVFYVQASEDLDLILVNELGQLVQEIHLQASNAYSAEVRNLASGLYFIKSANPALGISKKLMVQN